MTGLETEIARTLEYGGRQVSMANMRAELEAQRCAVQRFGILAHVTQEDFMSIGTQCMAHLTVYGSCATRYSVGFRTVYDALRREKRGAVVLENDKPYQTIVYETRDEAVKGNYILDFYRRIG